jgi:EAL domain-containing protein (putative c-di-GMP-specific phosphodiesterase class I)/GGDEF domain-containing protein
MWGCGLNDDRTTILDEASHQAVDTIIRDRLIVPLFQPIVDLRDPRIIGYEGLSRGPSDSPFHSPLPLFAAADEMGRLHDLEDVAIRKVAQGFVAMGGAGLLFINITPFTLVMGADGKNGIMDTVMELGLDPSRIVIELTECYPSLDMQALGSAAETLRKKGFRVALDDLGEGFSSLRLWSDICPNYIKVDRYFIMGVSRDPVKWHFLKSMLEIAKRTGSIVVAEGIETEGDLAAIQEVGIDLGQGYIFARPSASPSVSSEALEFARKARRARSSYNDEIDRASRAGILANRVESLPPNAPLSAALAIFARDASLTGVPIVDNGIPVGIVGRYFPIEQVMVPPINTPCAALMRRDIIAIDHNASLRSLGHVVAEGSPMTALHGFILTKDGSYLGMGESQALVREITKLQVRAAKHSNPLTGFPGNVPTDEHLQALIDAEVPFVIVHADLDHFKPFNDVYGYHIGDDIIRSLSGVLDAVCDPDSDFVGHVGGDDFILAFRSPDWDERCRLALAAFDADIRKFFTPEHLANGGYESEDRRGNRVTHPLVSLSLGAVRVEPNTFRNAHELGAAAAIAKKEAKRIQGSSLFVERRAWDASKVKTPAEGHAEADPKD